MAGNQGGVHSNLVVARFKDGRILKGRTFGVNLATGSFFVEDGEAPEGAAPTLVHLRELKAIYFVKDHVGDPSRKDSHPERPKAPPGERVVAVKFKDGEIALGSTLSYAPNRRGFFMTSLEDSTNNLRALVLSDAVEKMRFVGREERISEVVEELRGTPAEDRESLDRGTSSGGREGAKIQRK